MRETIRETDPVRTRHVAAVIVVGATILTTCGEDTASTPEPSSTSTSTTVGATSDQRFPDVVGVTVTADGGTFRFDVTVSSPYDTPERYADAWRVVAPDGTVLAVRELTHDHAAEQPFTRSLSGVVIPDDVTTVTVEGRDLLNGWGGGTRAVAIQR